jgi:hypothetical protein
MKSPFEDTFILTFGVEVRCIQVPNESSGHTKTQQELSGVSNSLDKIQCDSKCASLIRTNHSGALSRGFQRALMAIRKCEENFFNDGRLVTNVNFTNINDVAIPCANWKISQMDFRFKSVKSFEPAFSVTYTEDFMRVFSAFDQCWEDVQNTIENLIRAMIFRYYGNFVQDKLSPAKPYSLVIGSGFLEELHKREGLSFDSDAL